MRETRPRRVLEQVVWGLIIIFPIFYFSHKIIKSRSSSSLLSHKIDEISSKKPPFSANYVATTAAASKKKPPPQEQLRYCSLLQIFLDSNRLWKLFIISLPSSHDRRKPLLGELQSICLSHNSSFFPAVNGNDLELFPLIKSGLYDSRKSIAVHHRDLNRGEMGCSLSHIQVYKHIIEHGLEGAIILEDDVILGGGLQHIPLLITSLPHFDILYLNINGGFHAIDQSSTVFTIPNGPHRVHPIVSCCVGGSAAYVITKAGAKKLLSVGLPIYWASDGLMGRGFNLIENMTYFSLIPELLSRRSFASLIQGERKEWSPLTQEQKDQVDAIYKSNPVDLDHKEIICKYRCEKN